MHDLDVFTMEDCIQLLWGMVIFIVFFNSRLSPASKMKNFLLSFKQAEGIERMLNGTIIEMHQADLTFSTSPHKAIHWHRSKIMTHVELIIKKRILLFRFFYRTLSDEFEIGFTLFSSDISTWSNRLNDHLLLLHFIFLFICRNTYHFFGRLHLFCLFG